jgi:voltage-gated potassium channel Kch
MSDITFREKFQYRFDNLMARGTPAMLGGLAIVFFVSIIFFSALVVVFGISPEESEGSFLQLVWMSMMRTLDSGTMGGDKPPYGFLMLGVTFTGIFILSALIGILNSGLEARLEQLRKGRSRVIERDHSVILGWSDQVYTIISELATANESRGDACIVVMGEKDKVEMEDAIKEHVDDLKTTRVVCRQGSPVSPGDLAIVNLDDARSIVVLSPEKDNPDADVIKTILAIVNNPARRSEPYHIVAELRDPKNVDVARMVGKDEVEIILVGDLIARIIAQTCRQNGLSLVYTELLDYGGDEMYFHEEKKLVGRKFGEILLESEDSAVIGLASPGQAPRLNPPMETIIKKGDQLIVIAEDDSMIRFERSTAPIDAAAIRISTPLPPAPERTLILGWNWRVPTIIRELDNYVVPGSEAFVAADEPEGEATIQKACAGAMKNQKVTFLRIETTDRVELDALKVERFDHVILLCDSDRLSSSEADSRTLITLLHLRDMAEKTGKSIPIVSEMLDIKNRDLAQVARVNDFIVSDKLISLLLTQVAENKQLNAVFADLFDPDGSEIYVKSAKDYVKPGHEVSFATVVEAARRRGEIAIGYKIESQSGDPARSFGVVVNPEKSALVSFEDEDRVIVLAES